MVGKDEYRVKGGEWKLVGTSGLNEEVHDCCIRVTVLLEYISSQPSGVQLARPIRSEVTLLTVK